MQKNIKSRLPSMQSAISVFATAAFLVYGWTIYASFWKIPSWLFYLKIGEIYSVYAYSFIVNFLESGLLLSGVILANAFLSGNLWKKNFSSAAVAVIFILVGSAVTHLRLYEEPDLREDFISTQLLWWGSTFIVALLVSVVCARVAILNKWITNLADNMVVFLYIYIPLTIVSLIIVISRIFF
ncbi:MAG: hypothetical protein JXA13_10835 [Anaerolineales bacterium]|nr:hypothetical protein [Anaerolineales bacterium]